MIKPNLHGFALVCIAITLCACCNRALTQEVVSGTAVENSKEPPAAAEPELRMIVELADGSRVVGTPAVKELSLAGKIGTVRIPFKSISKVTFGPGEGAVTVSVANGDHLSGIIEEAAFNMEAAWGKVALPVKQIRTMTLQSAGSKWSVREDFSTTENPAGPWSYGWTSRAGGKLMLYQNKFHNDEGAHGWRMGDWIPGVWINEADHEMYGVQPRQVSMHPGARGEEAIARWEAPKTCTITVKGTFGAGDTGAVDVRVRHNGAVLFESLDARKDEPFSLEMIVKSGDVVEFAISAGRDGISNDNTPLDATVVVK